MKNTYRKWAGSISSWKTASLMAAVMCLLAANVSSQALQANDYWKQSEGLWSQHHTYLDGQFEYRIKSYHSLLDIRLDGDSVQLHEIKYYPPGTFKGASVGINTDDSLGVEFIQENIGHLKNAEGLVIFDAPENAKTQMRILPISKDSALMTVTHLETNADSYRMLITQPTDKHRYLVSLGIGLPGDAGALRGVSMNDGERLPKDQLATQQSTFRQQYHVGQQVTAEADGTFTLHRVNP